ncbi:9376_t:CDS:1, partial [Paraglomus occultum]
THNGKTIKIPLYTRKEKYNRNNVFNTEKWHAPKDFEFPDSFDTTIAEQTPEKQKKN